MCVSASIKTNGPPSDFHGEKKRNRVTDPHCSATNGARSTNKLNEVLRLEKLGAISARLPKKKNGVQLVQFCCCQIPCFYFFFRTGHWSVFLALSCVFPSFCTTCSLSHFSPHFSSNPSHRGSLQPAVALKRAPFTSLQTASARGSDWEITGTNSPSFEVPDRRHLVDIVPEMFVFCGWKGKLPLNQRWILIEIKPTICQQSSSLQWSWRKTWTSWAPATSLWPLAGCRSTASKWHVSQMPFQGINILRLIPKGLQLLYSLKYTFLLRQINSCITLRKGMRKYLVFVKNVMAVICV